MVCKWAKLGLTDQQIIERMGIKERTFYVWQKKYPAFQKALKEAKTIPNLDIETSMIDLACGRAYVEEIKSVIDPKTGTIIKVEKVRKQIPPSSTMLILLAKNRIRDKYRDYCPIYDGNVEDESVKQDVYLTMRVAKIILRPQRGPQEQFLATKADIAIYGGAAGGGKTYALLLEPLRHMNVEGYSSTIFRKNATQITIDGGLFDESMQIYGLLRSAVYKASPKPYWTFGGKAKSHSCILMVIETKVHRFVF